MRTRSKTSHYQVSPAAKNLLHEMFVSLQGEEIKFKDEPVPLSALIELVQHHPGLRTEVDAIRKYMEAVPIIEAMSGRKEDMDTTFVRSCINSRIEERLQKEEVKAETEPTGQDKFDAQLRKNEKDLRALLSK